MQVAPAAEPHALPTWLQLLGSVATVESGRHGSPGDAVSPLTSGSLRKRRNVGFRGDSSVAALAAVALLATAYLVLRCALYLASASRSSLRFLAGAENEANKDQEESCGPPAEQDRPAAAIANKKPQLLKRARRYVEELARLIGKNSWLVLKLKPSLKVTCVAKFLCLSLVEASALFALLERRDRAGITEAVNKISRRIWDLRDSIGEKDVSHARQRNLNILHATLNNLQSSNPSEEPMAEAQRLEMVEHLLQLQELALTQLNSGICWLRGLIQGSKDASTDTKPAAAAAEGAAAAGEEAGAVADGGDAVDEAKVAAAVKAIELTVHTRRDHILNDPKLSRWLRTSQPKGHYGITNRLHMEMITQQPLLTHPERLEGLMATPLGSGSPPWEVIDIEKLEAHKRAASSSSPEAPSRAEEVTPYQAPCDRPRAPGKLKSPGQGSRKGAGAQRHAPVASSPSTSSATDAASAAPSSAAASADAPERTDGALQDRSQGRRMPGRAAHRKREQVLSSTPTEGRQASAVNATTQAAAASSRGRPASHARGAFRASRVTSAGVSSDFGPSRATMPRRLPGPLPRAVSDAGDHAPEDVTGTTPAAPAAEMSAAYHSSGVSRGSGPAYGALPAVSGPQRSPTTYAEPQAEFERSRDSSNPLLGPSPLSLPQVHTPVSHFSVSPGAPGVRPLPTTGLDEGAPPSTGSFVSVSSTSQLQRPASRKSQTSPWIPSDYRSSLGIAKEEGDQELDTWPFASKVWGPPEKAPLRPPPGFSPIEEPDGRSHPEVATGLAQAEEFFRGVLPQQPRDVMHPRELPVAATARPPPADARSAAEASATADSSPVPSAPHEEGR
ncbi:uncharacterized protein EMH_0015220 [Eimeria mitis]|uniref:Uncharacterized protein n=1 Tax=Eimeria mitis TaxID=44415 RepID=U6K5Q2_9EIME|nr:uncharacterized protein EMH_0015220 [Eimeria mitis]CDJ33234.1 hypothetical protein, conserved [Eimeria mitis]